AMTKARSGRGDRNGARVDRRHFLKHCGGVAALGGAFARRASAEDAALDALMGDGLGHFGQDFDQASRTIHMPKASAPTLSPATAQTTERAIQAYDAIVARGGWPEVPAVDDL